MNAFLCEINYNLIVSLTTYLAFALIILAEVLKGYKRGVISASVRFGIFAGLMVVALFIATPIAKALMGVDVSFLGVEYEGEVQTTLPAVIKAILYQSQAIKDAAASSPALTAFIEGLPVALLSLVVFFILIWVFKLLSYTIFKILDRWALPSSKLHREYKKQLKLQKKAIKKGEKTVTVTLPAPPNKHKWAGAAVGLAMGLLMAFVVYLPFGATFGIIGDIAGTGESGVEAEIEFENLNQTSGDLVRYYLPKEAMESIDSYNNSFIAKFVSGAGFDNLIFDYLTQIDVEGKPVELRKELLNATNAYDSVVNLINQQQNNPEGWKGLSIANVENSFNTLLNSNLIDSLAPELIPYVLDNYIYDSSFFTNLPSHETLKTDIQALIAEYKENGFMKSVTADIEPIFRVIESALETKIIDEITVSNVDIDKITTYLKENDNKLLNAFVNLVFESKLIKVGASVGVNYAEKMLNEELSLNLAYVNSSFFKADEKKALTDIILAGLDAYDTVKDINFDDFDIADITNEQISAVANILTAVQNDVFKKYENGVLVLRTDAVVDKTNKTVTGGGMLSNVYITFVDYLLGDYLTSINYQNANWEDILTSVKNIASLENFEDASLDDIVNLLSLDENLAESAQKIADAVTNLDAENLTTEDVVEILGAVSEGLDAIDEDTFNDIIDKIASNPGMEDIATEVTYEYITDAKDLADDLVTLYNDDEITAEEVNDVIDDLVKYEFLVEKIADTGAQLEVAESEKAAIEDKINSTEVDDATKAYLKAIFGISEEAE
ncbi:MAG: hypothetical protein J5779_00375 [Clostridia bacterium]|nr:hypothetical protein [Clostridia bacterium]